MQQVVTLIISLSFFCISPTMVSYSYGKGQKKPADSFKPNVRLDADSLYPMAELDTEQFRSIRILDAQTVQAKNIEYSEQYLYFANFKRNKTYYIAAVPKNPKIEQVIFQYQLFFKLYLFNPGHGQIRFIADKKHPILLYPQSQPEDQLQQQQLNEDSEDSVPSLNEAADGMQLTDFTFSMNAVRVKGQTQVFRPHYEGIMKGYGTSYNFHATENTIAWLKKVPNLQIRQYQLKLTADEKAKLLLELISMSDQHQETTKYHTVTHNCVSTAVQAINRIRQPKKKIWIVFWWNNVLQFFGWWSYGPISIEWYLWKQQLIDKVLQPFEQEVQESERQATPPTKL